MEGFVYVFERAFPHPSKKVKGCVCFQRDQHACACTRTRNLIRTKTGGGYNGYVGFVLVNDSSRLGPGWDWWVRSLKERLSH